LINYVKLHANFRGTKKSPNKLSAAEIRLTRDLLTNGENLSQGKNPPLGDF